MQPPRNRDAWCYPLRVGVIVVIDGYPYSGLPPHGPVWRSLSAMSERKISAPPAKRRLPTPAQRCCGLSTWPQEREDAARHAAPPFPGADRRSQGATARAVGPDGIAPGVPDPDTGGSSLMIDPAMVLLRSPQPCYSPQHSRRYGGLQTPRLSWLTREPELPMAGLTDHGIRHCPPMAKEPAKNACHGE